MSEYTSIECGDARWWAGHAAGLRTALRVAEAVEDLDELVGCLQPLSDPAPVPTVHRLRRHHVVVIR